MTRTVGGSDGAGDDGAEPMSGAVLDCPDAVVANTIIAIQVVAATVDILLVAADRARMKPR